jgi:hypothetical protein
MLIYHEVFGFDITVDYVILMQVLKDEYENGYEELRISGAKQT